MFATTVRSLKVVTLDPTVAISLNANPSRLRSILKPSSLEELSVHVSRISVAEIAAATRSEGGFGARGIEGSRNIVKSPASPPNPSTTMK